MTNTMIHDYYNSDYIERDDLDWDDVMKPDEYLDHLDKRLYERSQRIYDWVFHSSAEKVSKFSTVFPQLKIGKKTYVCALFIS